VRTWADVRRRATGAGAGGVPSRTRRPACAPLLVFTPMHRIRPTIPSSAPRSRAPGAAGSHVRRVPGRTAYPPTAGRFVNGRRAYRATTRARGVAAVPRAAGVGVNGREITIRSFLARLLSGFRVAFAHRVRSPLSRTHESDMPQRTRRNKRRSARGALQCRPPGIPPTFRLPGTRYAPGDMWSRLPRWGAAHTVTAGTRTHQPRGAPRTTLTPRPKDLTRRLVGESSAMIARQPCQVSLMTPVTLTQIC
jgi:hypothetical protein